VHLDMSPITGIRLGLDYNKPSSRGIHCEGDLLGLGHDHQAKRQILSKVYKAFAMSFLHLLKRATSDEENYS
jgi:hypothetical protein